MTAHEYLIGILNGQQMRESDLNTLRRLRDEIEGNLRKHIGYASRFYYGGSFGKKTMIRESYDLDIAVYFPQTDQRPLRTIYSSVHEALSKSNYIVRPKTVALELPYEGGFHIDVVPGRAQDHTYVYATLYKNGENSTIQTSLKVHIDSVRPYRDIIKLMKLWKLRSGVTCKSFVIEQVVTRAVGNMSQRDYGECVWEVLRFFRDKMPNVRLVDPANSNNVIELTYSERSQLQNAAAHSLNAQYWRDIIY